MSTLNLNKTLNDNGFDFFGNRSPIANNLDEQVEQSIQKFQQAMILPDLAVANNTFRAWGHGARVKNGAGFFCAPNPTQHPTKNADYFRMFCDSGNTVIVGGSTTFGSPIVNVTGAGIYVQGMTIRGPNIPDGTYIKYRNSSTQIVLTKNATGTGSGLTFTCGEGIGVISLPMSDMAWVKSTDGNIIFRLLGNRTNGASSTGILDLWSVLNLLTGGNTVETSGKFNNAGAVYYNTATNKFRGYNSSAWSDLGGSVSSKVILATHSNSATGVVTYAHELGKIPASISVQSTNIVGGQSFSFGTYDGTSNKCIYGGVNAGNSNGQCVWVDQGGGNSSFGQVSALDATNITITWDKIGTPTSTCNLIFTSLG